MLSKATIKNAPQLLARLSESERITIRAANPDRLEFLRTTEFASDGPVSAETMAEVKAAVDAAFAAYDATWRTR